MNDIAIRVDGLSTRYCIGPRERYEALRDVITDVFAAPFRRLRENSQFAIPVCRCTGRRNPQSLVPASPIAGAIRNSQFEIRWKGE